MEYHRQEAKHTCGPACMRMVLSALEIRKTEKILARILKTGKRYGTLNRNFPLAARKYNLKYRSCGLARISDLRDIMKQNYIVIVCYFLEKEYHYAVVRKITRSHIYLHDPLAGPDTKFPLNRFRKIWKSDPKVKEEDMWFFAVKKQLK